MTASGHVLAKNTMWNLVGAAAPLLVAVLCIPILVDEMGAARFGILALAWVVIGYFGLFDLGLGRALTKLVADELGAGREEQIPVLAWTALTLMLALGIGGGLILGALTPQLVRHILKIPVELQAEASGAFYVLAASIPVVISTAGLRGLLEAHQRFDLVNAVRVPQGIFSFLGPILVLPFSHSLLPIVAVLACGRAVGWLVHLLLCFHAIPALRHEIRVQRSLLRPLLAFGSWMTVSNIVSPLMVYLDRFLIGAILSVTAVTYYATPYEVVIRLAVIPSALVAVLFPAFASGIAQGSSRTVLLFGRGMKYVFLAMFLPVFLIVTLAPEGLAVWLGPDFALRSGAVLQWLALGVFANGLARVPFALVQALGRPDLTAKLHLVELVLYVPVLWMLLGAYGIIGAAVAWAVRVAVDLVLLLGIVRRLLPAAAPLVERTCWATGLGVATLTTAALIPSLAMRGVFAAFVAVGFLVTAWTVALDPDERAFLRRRKAARR